MVSHMLLERLLVFVVYALSPLGCGWLPYCRKEDT